VWGAAAGHHQPQEHGQDELGKVTQELLTRHDSPSMSASTRHVPMRTARRARGEVQTSVRSRRPGSTGRPRSRRGRMRFLALRLRVAARTLTARWRRRAARISRYGVDLEVTVVGRPHPRPRV